MKIGTYETHPLADCFPRLDGKDFVTFADDILAHGLREPIVMFEGKILDGRNRLAGCIYHGVEPRFTEYAGTDPAGFVRSLNLNGRRHLSESQRALAAAGIAKYLGESLPDDSAIADQTQAETAASFNVSEDSVARAKAVIAKGTPGLVAAVRENEVSVSAAALVADLPDDEQAALVAQGAKAIRDAATDIRKAKKPKAEKKPASASKAKTKWNARKAIDEAMQAIEDMVEAWPTSEPLTPVVEAMKSAAVRFERIQNRRARAA